MAGAREEAFDEQRYNEQERKDHAAEPPRDGRPLNLRRKVWEELEKEHAGGGENGSGKKEPGTENQGDAILGALETDESDGGENKS
jgi:hypothetical protein